MYAAKNAETLGSHYDEGAQRVSEAQFMLKNLYELKEKSKDWMVAEMKGSDLTGGLSVFVGKLEVG